MPYIEMYKNAMKKIHIKYYLTPFLLLVYLGYIPIIWRVLTDFIHADEKYYFIFIITFIQAYGVVFLCIFFYPHVSFFIQSTRLYQKVFGTTLGALGSGLFTYANIGKNIPDDYHMKGSNGTRYTISAGAKTKTDRVRDARGSYGVMFIYKFVFIDILLRLFLHLGIFMVSPILFFIAVPLLNKNGRIQYIEK